MPLEVKQLNCPKCGSPLDIKNAGRSKTIVCPSCGSQIDLSSPDYQILGRVGSRPAPKMTPFSLGMRGTVDGKEHEIIGRVRYTDDEDAWDEWLLLTADGDYDWISEDEDEGMVLWHSFTPTQPVDPNTVRQGSTINLGEGSARVRERGRATIGYLEGELTWKARLGETMQYLDAEGAGGLYSIEWTPDEIEFWRGHRENAAEVARAFGISRAVAAVPASVAAASVAGKAASSIGVILSTAIVCILLMCVAVALAGGTSSTASAELVCNTPVPGSLAFVGTPTPTEDLSEEDTTDVTPTPPPNCYYRTVTRGGSGFFLLPAGSIRSGSTGRGVSGSGK